MAYFDPVDQKQDFPKLEHEIMKFWEKNNTFRKSIEMRNIKDAYVFYDGPPFATGLPHYGHILAGTIKDAIPRFFAMRGKRIERRFGWDCHGVPVEFQVEKENKIGGKPEIEKMGVGKYNEMCRSIVMRCAQEWEKTVTRMGRWVDFEDDYKTMSPEFMESVWWVFKTLWDKGLIYEGDKVVPYSPKLGSPLSNFEAGLNYKDIDDPAVTVRFELEDEPGTYILAWTTTPWTLPSNLALAIHPDMEYVKIEYQNKVTSGIQKIPPGEEITNKIQIESGTVVLAKSLVPKFFNPRERKSTIKTLESYTGKELVKKYKRYKPIFPFFADHQNAFQILTADFVSEEEGTGIVHMAPTGIDDVPVLEANKISLLYPFDENCYFDATIPELEGKYFRDDPEVPSSKENNANDWVVDELKKSGALFRHDRIRHSYPHCWRTESALMYRGVKTWFVEVTKIKNQMLKNNAKIHWVPDAIGHKRFHNWLENAQDWAISRNRYWGAPLPIWRCTQCEHVECIGSIEELQDKSTKLSKVFVMRHGEGEHNITGMINSDAKTPVALTEKGKQQAEATGKKLKKEKIDLMISSPFLRTTQTAEIVAEHMGYPKNKIIIDERLKEIDAGDYEGKSLEEFRALFATASERYYKNTHNGETECDVFDRVSKLLQEIQKKYAGKNILLVTHGDPARNIRKFFTHETADILFGLQEVTKKLLDPAEYEIFSFSGRPENPSGEIDIHRPYIDVVKLDCPKCTQEMERVPEVLDCWFESGSMPYAQNHYPFENKEKFEQNFPADFIAEGLDQTRGWFYTLHVLSTALFDKPTFKNVIVNGIVLAEDGQKMSKSKKNYPDPHEVFEKFGVDAVRFTLLNSPVVKADDLRFSEKSVLENMRNIFLPFWNSYSFFVTYANIDEWTPVGSGELGERSKKNSKLQAPSSKLDKWILTELRELVRHVTHEMEGYDLYNAVKDIRIFLDKLTNGYVRRSRRRFWKSGMGQDKEEAFQTLHTVLTTFCQVLAPFAPFMVEHMYQNLTKQESVHLTDFPNYKDFPDDPHLRQEFEVLETIISLGLSLRAQKKIKLRQPLAEVEIFLPEKISHSILKDNTQMILKELNVKALKLMKAAEEICECIVKPDARKLGPKFGKDIQQIIQMAKSGQFVEQEGGVQVGEYFLEEGTYEMEYHGKDEHDVTSSGGIVVSLDMHLTQKLKNEGIMREFVRFVQDARKEAGFDVADRIKLAISGNKEILKILQQFETEISAEVLAKQIEFKKELENSDFYQEFILEGQTLQIYLVKK